MSCKAILRFADAIIARLFNVTFPFNPRCKYKATAIAHWLLDADGSYERPGTGANVSRLTACILAVDLDEGSPHFPAAGSTGARLNRAFWFGTHETSKRRDVQFCNQSTFVKPIECASETLFTFRDGTGAASWLLKNEGSEPR